MSWGWPWPSTSCCCAPVPSYHIRKYANSSAMPVLANQSDNRSCLGLRWDGTQLVSVYNLTEPSLGTASGSNHFMRAIGYDSSLVTVQQVLHELNSTSPGNPSRHRSVVRCGDGTYAMECNAPLGVASVNAGGGLDWENSDAEPSAGIIDQSICVAGDGVGNVYLSAATNSRLARLIKYDSGGAPQWVAYTGFGSGPAGVITPRLNVLDSSGAVWVSHNITNVLNKVDSASGTILLRVDLIGDPTGNLESDGAGGVWVGVGTNIYRYDSSGAIVAHIIEPLLKTYLIASVSVASPFFAVDSSNNVYGLILDSGIWKVRKWNTSGSGTSGAMVVEWTSGDVGWFTVSVTSGPRAIATDGTNLYVGGAFYTP